MWKYLAYVQLWILLLCIPSDVTAAEANKANRKIINLVGIIDESSSLSAIVQLFSVVSNLNNPEILHVHYLLFPSDYMPYSRQHSPHASANESIPTNKNHQDLSFASRNFSEAFSRQVHECFPSLEVEFVSWQPPPSMQYLRNHSFEQQHIFARFYLPTIFPSLDHFLYLDNDIIVNMDITPLVFFPLIATSKSNAAATSTTTTKPAASSIILASTESNNPSRMHYSQQRQHSPPAATTRTVTFRSHPAVLAMLTEEHPIYRGYLSNHFNQSHPFFLRAKAHLGESTFLNAGVFVVNARLWRQQRFTEQVEALLRENAEQGYHLYDTAVGDQGPFYLLFHSDMTPLPAEYNMRRLPKKTFLMLDKQAQGVIHFASVTHGDALYLCRYPILHEMLSRAATPLYLATMQAFAHRHCPTATPTPTDHRLTWECQQISRLCPTAAQELRQYLQQQNITPHYASGKAPLSTWPLKEQLWPLP